MTRRRTTHKRVNAEGEKQKPEKEVTLGTPTNYMLLGIFVFVCISLLEVVAICAWLRLVVDPNLAQIQRMLE